MIRSCLITAGPTRERIDPVRFISNYSTGTFGYAIAREARRRGLRTMLISGPTALEAPRGVRRVTVESALEMRAAIKRAFRKHDCLIMAAAVSDWRIERPLTHKIKRGARCITLHLVPNPDIVREVCRNKRGKMVVGFALETGDLVKSAGKKLKEKNLDLIVANKLGKKANVFGAGQKTVEIIDKAGVRQAYIGKTKAALAKIILDKVLAFTI